LKAENPEKDFYPYSLKSKIESGKHCSGKSGEKILSI
jgi:hypothetical protein